MCVNCFCNKTSVLKSFLQQKSVRKSFSRQKKYLKLQFDVQVRIICCFCNVLSSNHAWLYILGKAHTQLPFLTHLILVPSLGCVFLMRTCYRLIKIRQNRGERIVFWWPNTNTNIIWVPKNDRIRILFGLPKMTEYEYEYYSAPQKRPNTNTNIIRLSKNDRIRIRILLDSLKTQRIFFCISTTIQYQRSIHSF